ncbi:MAG: hypothetical protein ACRCY5_07925 [Phocaeicola sp.]
MRKIGILGMILMLLTITIPAMATMSASQIRKNSRFLTDRMAHELNLSNYQYDDVYEVNYDFLHNVRYLLDDVARGIPRAIESYYDFLDTRNDDLRWILSNSQYRRFMNDDYFYRPIYAQNNRWQLRVYVVYTNVNFFYFGKPKHYSSYRGGHYRSHHNNISFYQKRYKQRYKHDLYRGHYNIRNDRDRYEEHKNNDFGHGSRPSTSRPTTSRPESSRPTTGRPESSRPTTGRPEGSRPTTGRPEGGRPATGRPEGSRPTTGKPEGGRPATGKPESSRPTTGKPEGGRPATGKPEGGRPATGRPESSRPATSRPGGNSSSTSRPSSSDSKTKDIKNSNSSTSRSSESSRRSRSNAE